VVTTDPYRRWRVAVFVISVVIMVMVGVTTALSIIVTTLTSM
jgi:hypothetical protein